MTSLGALVKLLDLEAFLPLALQVQETILLKHDHPSNVSNDPDQAVLIRASPNLGIIMQGAVRATSWLWESYRRLNGAFFDTLASLTMP